MKVLSWQIFRKWPRFLATEAFDPEMQEFRIRTMERNISLPIKAMVMVVLVYYLFFSRWFDDVGIVHEVPLEAVQKFFLFYFLINVASAIMLYGMAQIPLPLIQWIIFTTALIDGLFLASLTLVTGGFDSVLFWVFLGLIIRNAVSVSVPALQILLNVLVSSSYILAGIIDIAINKFDPLPYSDTETSAEPVLLRVSMLFLMTLCCYGVQILLDRQRRADDEAREFSVRREQLRVTGQLAAEIAHQLKNPLGIINNAAFNLQRNVKEGKATITQQIKIIREEVERSDRIITDLMGYARLSEGKVEKLNAIEELDHAIDQVFPPAAHYAVEVMRDYAPVLPPLLMQRGHLSEILVNLLTNSREAINANGRVYVSAHYGQDYSVIITVSDSGPGVPPELREKVFEPYFTTKEKGTGLGLAIVKHNVEIYGGKVTVENLPGRGTQFVLQFPGKSIMRLRK